MGDCKKFTTAINMVFKGARMRRWGWRNPEAYIRIGPEDAFIMMGWKTNPEAYHPLPDDLMATDWYEIRDDDD